MTIEEMNTYKMRISQAGIAELTLIMLEMEMQWTQEACDAYENNMLDEFLDCVNKAQSTQIELMNVLNLENTVSVDVYSVFVYINKMLIQSEIKQEPQDLMRCVGMLRKFYDSLQKIAKTDTAGPVMEKSEKVYAGLTYGAGGLVENSVGGHDYSV
ncbi:MAG: flagellar protein FliS [Eubacteriales bacterium]|nr:flagellar protein FliS [Eubacteriales bacterium]